MLSVSPEVGVSFLAGITAYALYTAYRRNLRWLALPAACFLGSLAFLLWIGPGYLATLRRFGDGMLNRVVAPTPEILFLLLCAVALAPLTVAGYLRANSPDTAPFLGLYLSALAFIPPALGLCDGLHTFFNGIGLSLLAFVAAAQRSALWSKLCIIAFLLIAMPTQLQNIAQFVAARHSVQRTLAEQDMQVTRWEQETHGSKIFAPAGLPFHMRKKLLKDGCLESDFFSGLDNAFDPSAEAIKAREMQGAAFVLAPGIDLTPPLPDVRRRVLLLRFGYRYPIRFRAFLPLQQLRYNLQIQAVPVGTASPDGGLILYRRK